MKSRLTETKVEALPSTYQGLKEKYLQLLACQEEYKRNVILQAETKARGIIDKDSHGAFCRAVNILALAMKLDGRFKPGTMERLMGIVVNRILPERKRYINDWTEPDNLTSDGASDDWLRIQLEGWPYLEPGSEM